LGVLFRLFETLGPETVEAPEHVQCKLQKLSVTVRRGSPQVVTLCGESFGL